MPWKINFSLKADKQLSKLDHEKRMQIRNYLRHNILKLNHPKQLGKSLSNDLRGLWRYRVDKFRIICDIQDNTLTILVISIGLRDDIYN